MSIRMRGLLLVAVLTAVTAAISAVVLSGTLSERMVREHVGYSAALSESLIPSLLSGAPMDEQLRRAVTHHPELSFLAVGDAAGQITAHTLEGELPGEVIHALAESSQGMPFYDPAQRMLVRAEPLTGLGHAYLYMGLDLSDAWSGITTGIWRIVAIGVCMGLVALLAVQVLSRTYTRALDALAGELKHYGAGRQTRFTPPESAPPEIRNLFRRVADTAAARQQAEQLATRLGRVVEGAANEIYLFDAETLRFSLVNRGARDNVGYDMAELSTMTPLDLDVELSEAAIRSMVDDLCRGRQRSIAVRTRIRRKNGTAYHVEGTLQLAASEMPPTIVAIFEDVSDVLAAERERRRMERMLNESERLTRTGSWELDLDSFEVRWSDAFYRMIGLDPKRDRPDYRGFLRLLSVDDRAAVAEVIEQARHAPDGWRWQEEVTLDFSDGRVLNVLIHAVKSAPGGEEGSVLWGTFQDLTEQVKVQRQLSRSLELLETAQALSNVGSWERFDDGVERWSRETYRILEYDSAAPASFERLLERVHPEDRDQVVAMWERTSGPSPAAMPEFQHRLLFPDGRIKYVVQQSLLEQEASAGVRCFGTLQDVTDRVVSERELARERDFARSLLDLSPVIVVVLDPRGCVEYVNPYFERLTGYRADDIRGWPWVEKFISPAEQERVASGMERAMNGEPSIGFVSPVLDSRGEEHLVEWYDRAIVTAGGNSRRLLGIGLDVTERARSARALADSEAQLRQAQKMEAIGRLTGGVAHDFNNLLSVVVGNLDLLGTEIEFEGEQRELVKGATDAAMRGGQLTRKLLAFARQQTLLPAVVDPVEQVREFRPILAAALGEHHGLEIRTEGAVSRCHVDATQLETALLNLVLNARDAMPDGGRVRVTVEERALDRQGAPSHVAPGRYVAIGVHDTGVGMSPEMQERVLEPFFTTKDFGQGSGLGLSMVHGFARQSGGELIIDSREGAGASVWILLPQRNEKSRAD